MIIGSGFECHVGIHGAEWAQERAQVTTSGGGLQTCGGGYI